MSKDSIDDFRHDKPNKSIEKIQQNFNEVLNSIELQQKETEKQIEQIMGDLDQEQSEFIDSLIKTDKAKNSDDNNLIVKKNLKYNTKSNLSPTKIDLNAIEKRNYDDENNKSIKLDKIKEDKNVSSP